MDVAKLLEVKFNVRHDPVAKQQLSAAIKLLRERGYTDSEKLRKAPDELFTSLPLGVSLFLQELLRDYVATKLPQWPVCYNWIAVDQAGMQDVGPLFVHDNTMLIGWCPEYFVREQLRRLTAFAFKERALDPQRTRLWAGGCVRFALSPEAAACPVLSAELRAAMSMWEHAGVKFTQVYAEGGKFPFDVLVVDHHEFSPFVATVGQVCNTRSEMQSLSKNTDDTVMYPVLRLPEEFAKVVRTKPERMFVLLHLLGHVLGLRNTDEQMQGAFDPPPPQRLDAASIMHLAHSRQYATHSAPLPCPSPGDLALVRLLYAAHAPPAPPPPPPPPS
mmetsp:Transcript_15510/g.39605  ORF Transcript_15510/g.39605 Transcript_15510/m.39605 type:complete len:331 (-) Transcript_15510:166-1158(-)